VWPLNRAEGNPGLLEICDVLQFPEYAFVKIRSHIEDASGAVTENKNKRVIVLWRHREVSLVTFPSAAFPNHGSRHVCDVSCDVKVNGGEIPIREEGR